MPRNRSPTHGVLSQGVALSFIKSALRGRPQVAAKLSNGAVSENGHFLSKATRKQPSALKGRNILAQGNALGTACDKMKKP